METTNNDSTQVVQIDPATVSYQLSADSANVDIQVATAHRYPRKSKVFLENAMTIVTLDQETANSCNYAITRQGKPIMGPSVHLAKILAQQYGNLRVEAKVVQITNTQVVSQGMAWDLENNYAAAFEVRRSIVGKGGKRFTEDMITVTGNAANSIAYRNAVFSVIPRSYINAVYNAAKRCITGDLTDEDKLNQRRAYAIQHFEEFGITQEELIKLCGKQTLAQIKADEIMLLVGVYQALIDGDTTVDDVMAPIRGTREHKVDRLTDIARKSSVRKNGNTEAQKPQATQPQPQPQPQSQPQPSLMDEASNELEF